MGYLDAVCLLHVGGLLQRDLVWEGDNGREGNLRFNLSKVTYSCA